jgi:hypothetical protein
MQATHGHICGTATLFGACFPGTFFSLSAGSLSRSFAETQTTLGAVGAIVHILGNSLTGTSAVTFNGTGATFQIGCQTEITTTVPNGATTGVVAGTTPQGIRKTGTDDRTRFSIPSPAGSQKRHPRRIRDVSPGLFS